MAPWTLLVIGAATLVGAVAAARSAPWLARLARWADLPAEGGAASGVLADTHDAGPPSPSVPIHPAARADPAPDLDPAASRASQPRWWLRPVGAGVVAGLALAPALTAMTLRATPSTSAWIAWPGLALAWWAAAAACLVDAAAHRLPNVLVMRVGGIGLVLAVLGLLGAGGAHAALSLFAGAAVAGAPLGLVALVHPPSMGLGDVKLAALLGALVLGPAAAAGMLVLAFLVGGLAALGLVATRRAAGGSALPFGPMLFLGALGASWLWSDPAAGLLGVQG